MLLLWRYLDLHIGDGEPVFYLALSDSEEKSAKMSHLSLLLLFVPLLHRPAPLHWLWPIQLTFLEKNPVHTMKTSKKGGRRGGVMSPHLVLLLQSRHHDDDAAPFLPHHVPEVPHSVQHRPLGGDEGSGSSSVTL